MADIVSSIASLIYFIITIIILLRIVESFLYSYSSTISITAYIILLIIINTIQKSISSAYLGLLIAIIIFVIILYEGKLREWQSESQQKVYADDNIYRYKAIIAADPGNIAARSALVDSLASIRKYDEAITEQQHILDIVKDNSIEKRKLTKLLEDREEDINGIIVCPSCGYRNYRNLKECRKCYEKLRIIEYIKVRIVKGGIKRILISISVLIGVILLALLTSMGLTYILLAIIVVSFFLFLVMYSKL